MTRVPMMEYCVAVLLAMMLFKQTDCSSVSDRTLSGGDGGSEGRNINQLIDQVINTLDSTPYHSSSNVHVSNNRQGEESPPSDIDTVQDRCPHQCQLARRRRRDLIELLRQRACNGNLHYVLVGVVTNISDRYYKVDVQAVFKIGLISIKTKGLKILRTDRLNVDTAPLEPRCACPSLIQGKRYLLSGREYLSGHTLMLGPMDVVMRWKARWQRTIESNLVRCSGSPLAQNLFGGRTAQSALAETSSLLADDSWEKR